MESEETAALGNILVLYQKWITLPLFANRCRLAVARIHHRFIRQRHQFTPQRIHDFFHRAAPQIGAPDAPGKEGVAGEERQSNPFLNTRE